MPTTTTVNVPWALPIGADGIMTDPDIGAVALVQPVGKSVQQIGDINISGTVTSSAQSGSAVKVGTLAGADADAENWIEQASTTKTALVLQAKSAATDSVLEVQNASATPVLAVNILGMMRSAGLTNPSNEMLLSSTALDMNATNATVTALYTVPTGVTCCVTKVVLRNASTSLTTASWSVGFNATTDNDFRADATSTGVNGATKAYIYYGVTTGVVVGAAAAVFAFKLNSQQGAPATATIDCFGYLF